MDRETAVAVLKKLSVWYPRQYAVQNLPHDARVEFAADLLKNLIRYDSEEVLQAYETWHTEHKFPPSLAEIIQELKKTEALTIERVSKDIPPGWTIIEDYEGSGQPLAIPPALWYEEQRMKGKKK